MRRKEAADAQRRLSEMTGKAALMTPALAQRMYEDSLKARWSGGPTVLAFLFAPPDSSAIRMLDVRGDYFDIRTGDTWDLFFPGYYRSGEGPHFETQTGAHPVGRGYASDWYFNSREFDQLREHVEHSSGGRWKYSGGADLVLINAWLVEDGEPTIDWMSTIAGEVTDHRSGARTLTLAGVVERITRDLQTAAEDPSYGVGRVTGDTSSEETSFVRDLILSALGGISAALAGRALDR